MIKGLIGKKLGMTRFFLDDGTAVPVTVIQAGPCTVVQKKTAEKDGYEALQIGFGEKKKANKPMLGHCAAVGSDKAFAVLKEFEADSLDEYESGGEITLNIFQIGEKINITGSTKGRGYAGVIKRHGFGGGRSTHGSTTHRRTGSIGMAATPSRVLPGRRMPGRMGNSTKTTRNLEIVDVREDYGVILVKGAVPGPSNGLLFLKKK